MARFILVHGAWHGGWCWHKVASALREAGHDVLAPDLPGHGDDTTPPAAIDLQTYVDFVCDLIDEQSGEVVLVGHSLGGLTITQVAELRPDRLRCLIYLAALVPESGEDAAPGPRLVTEAVSTAVRESADGLTVELDPAVAHDVFYADCSEADSAFARERLCGEPTPLMRARVQTSDEAWGRVPRDYIVCSQDRALAPEGQRELAEGRGFRRTHTLDRSHSPFFSAPGELAKLLSQIADT
jgi:pimeloyl-ACP methyl ester carboxylesterase